MSTQSLQCIVNVNFDLATLFYGKCCSSKTISARRSADGYKSPQRDALRFIFCRRRRLFVAFSEREPFLRGFPCGIFGIFLVPKLYLCVKKMCKKFREIPTVGLDLGSWPILTTPPNRASLKLVNLQRILNSSKLVILQRINVVKVFFQYFYNIY